MIEGTTGGGAPSPKRAHAPVAAAAINHAPAMAVPAMATRSGSRSPRSSAQIPLTVANATTLAPAAAEDRELVIAAAARLGRPRLIDNLTLSLPAA